ncbi:hypothetical protein ACFTWS_13990 [Streptomyces sp. NPDC057027]|uniref:hypothetical protein n=1 Tax=Streptomyces sp. NPDC057027 TaxID=3346004 RepID=UPI0036330413
MRDALLGLAGNPALTDELFARLVADGDEDVLYALAGREQPTASQVRALLGVGDPEVTSHLVRIGLVPWSGVPEDHPGRALDAVIGGVAPLDIWWEAAADPDPGVREEVAYEADAPAAVLAALAHDVDPGVVRGAAGNPCLPPTLFPGLARHPSTVVREAVAGNENAPAALLAALLADGGRPAPTRCGACHRREAACPDHAPGVRRVRLAAAAHPAVPPAGLAAFLDAPEAWTFAARTDLPPGFLDRLAEHPDADVRAVIAANPAVREALLRTLVADRTRLPGDLVEQLAADPDPGVARRIAARPDLAPEQLADLVERHGPPVFSAVARHPDCPATVLHRVAAHPTTGRRVLRDIARHPAARAETLLRCLTAEDPDVRRYAAGHPALPVAVLESLLHGPDETLALAAAENPALPETLMRRIVE